MTTFWSDWELQEETGLEFEYRKAPKPAKDVRFTPMVIKSGGYAEIKPHHLRGMKAGMCQLALNRTGGTRILITYLPLNSSDVPIETGTPDKVQVHARHFVRSSKATDLENPHQWWNLGFVPPPKGLTLALKDRQKFGVAIEEPVRTLFGAVVLKPPRRMRPHPGGPRRGPDVLWDELADLYAELGRELRDPLYAELALELSGQRA